jgi:phage-related protein
MGKRYNVKLLDEVYEFFDSIDNKAVEKILYNIDKAQSLNDNELFKKLSNEIWEFRTLHKTIKYRLLGFWDKTNNNNTLVIATHGFIKKSQKTPLKEIEKARRIRKQYFNITQ